MNYEDAWIENKSLMRQRYQSHKRFLQEQVKRRQATLKYTENDFKKEKFNFFTSSEMLTVAETLNKELSERMRAYYAKHAPSGVLYELGVTRTIRSSATSSVVVSNEIDQWPMEWPDLYNLEGVGGGVAWDTARATYQKERADYERNQIRLAGIKTQRKSHAELMEMVKLLKKQAESVEVSASAVSSCGDDDDDAAGAALSAVLARIAAKVDRIEQRLLNVNVSIVDKVKERMEAVAKRRRNATEAAVAVGDDDDDDDDNADKQTGTKRIKIQNLLK